MTLRLLLPLILLCLAGGFAGGLWGWRHLDRLGDARPPQRPDGLERAWNAWDAGDDAALAGALDALSSFDDERWRRESELLRLLAARDWREVRAFADRHAQAPAGAQALRALIDHATDAAERAALESLFAQRFPASSYAPKEP